MVLAQLDLRPDLKDTLLPFARERVRREMAARDLSVTALAAELGVSRKHLSGVLNGRVPLTEDLGERLGRALGLSQTLMSVWRHDGIVPPPFRPGCMRDRIQVLADPTEPMEGWFEDED